MVHTPVEADEVSLLEEIAAGQQDTTVLEDRYKARLVWFARVMGVSPEDCADLVQDVFLIAIREIRADHFRRDSSLITWLDGILKNKVKDFWRAQNRRRSLFTTLDPTVSVYPVRWDDDIDVRGVLGRMPKELRTILLLNETEGLTVEEIAKKLKKRPGTVGRKLAEAKNIFRCRLVEARLGALQVRKVRRPKRALAAAG